MGIVADAQAGLAAVLYWLRATGRGAVSSPAYLDRVKQLRDEWLAQVRELATSDHSPVTISRLIAELRAFLDRDAIVLTSSGNAQAQWFQETMVYEPNTNS